MTVNSPPRSKGSASDAPAGGLDEEEAKAFIKARFLEKNRTKRKIFTHFTIAVDTKNIQFVFKVVRETLMRDMLREMF